MLPATIISKSLFKSSLFFGFTIYSPLIYPILTAATGPPKGIHEIVSAALEAIKAKASVGISESTERTVGITCTSFLKPSGNKGLKGLSIILDINISLSLGLPSLFKNPPGIFPPA